MAFVILAILNEKLMCDRVHGVTFTRGRELMLVKPISICVIHKMREQDPVHIVDTVKPVSKKETAVQSFHKRFVPNPHIFAIIV